MQPNRRRGRGKAAASIALVEAAATILKEIQPASVRAVCYRLFVLGLIKDMSKNSTGKVGTQLVTAREEGVIPWEWIVDETREAERVSTWEDPDAIIRAAVRSYRRDYWQDQPNRVEIWSEKGTIRGTLAPVLHEHGVSFRVMHGFASATALNSAAEDSIASDKPLTVLYLGDWDPSGLNMSEVDLPARLARYGGELKIKRIALTEADVGPGTTLPSFSADTKTGDSRHEWFVYRYGSRCWELDAMNPAILRQRVEDEITALLDVDRWNHAITIEKAERESMGDFMRAWNLSKSQPDPKYSEGRT